MRQQDVALEGLGDVFGLAERRAERVMRRQDVALEGLGDVFGRAEESAERVQQVRARIKQQLRELRARREAEAKEEKKEPVLSAEQMRIMNEKSVDLLVREAVAVGIKKPRQVFKGPGMMDRLRRAIVERL
jgi:hypothetical protein